MSTEFLRLLDNLAVKNAGPVVVNGHDYIAIRRQDWEALLALRGDAEAVLARMDSHAEPRDTEHCVTRAEADRRMAELGKWLGV